MFTVQNLNRKPYNERVFFFFFSSVWGGGRRATLGDTASERLRDYITAGTGCCYYCYCIAEAHCVFSRSDPFLFAALGRRNSERLSFSRPPPASRSAPVPGVARKPRLQTFFTPSVRDIAIACVCVSDSFRGYSSYVLPGRVIFIFTRITILWVNARAQCYPGGRTRFPRRAIM